MHLRKQLDLAAYSAAAAALFQVCDYLADGETPDHAVQRAQQLLQLTDLQPSAVLQLETTAVEKPKVVVGAAVANSSSSSRGGSMACSGPVLAAAAAGVVAALSVGIAVMNMS